MKKVLVVDDEEDIRILIQTILTEDYDVLTAANGQEAIERVEEEHPDLILLDIRMPGIDGLEVLRQVKETHQDIQAIMITSFSSQESRLKAKNLGASYYLVKPFNIDEVKATVKKALKD